MQRLKVHHFGPDPAYVGGMGSVIRVLTEHRVGSDAAVLHPTWRPNARFGSLSLALAAGLDIVRMRKSEIAHVHLAQKGGVIREGALVLLARARGVLTVVTVHGSTFLPFARRHPGLVAGILRRAHIVTCLDSEVREYVRQIAPGTRIELVPNPVPMDTESPCVRETQETVVFAGEIGLRKGADVLCKAWRQVADTRPQARCIMVGPVKDFSVPDTERLEVRAPVDAAAMRELLRSARVVALPSRAEGMPMVLTEAMGAARPFVSTPVGGIPELAQGGGVLVPVGDDASLAKWLIAFLADPQLAHRVGERGREFCSATRSVEVVGEQLRALYGSAREVGARR